MARFITNRGGAILISALLLIQFALFLLSLDAGAFLYISAFCTGPAASRLGLLFGSLHLVLVMLFLMGLLSLSFARLRLAYIGLVMISLALLPVQATFVSQGALTCDGP
ncbi:MAG: hypothetical protein ABIT16_12225 [Croceibacterium sp.]